MSVMFCETHSQRWDSDFVECCPACEPMTGEASSHGVGGLPDQALVARINAQFNRAEEAEADRDELLEILHDLVMLNGEERAIGGGPGFKERSAKAWSRARERFEP